ncbi:hypothetical protein [uncultured Muribaculum sp.]|uniref:hypothetical protein n=1 Tax=uncultured Muribaculum sp. TaxID=1918613 RepID=UPI0025ADD6E4|nr:hypothetical protein [uncultured Muribaculum sp.]
MAVCRVEVVEIGLHRLGLGVVRLCRDHLVAQYGVKLRHGFDCVAVALHLVVSQHLAGKLSAMGRGVP